MAQLGLPGWSLVSKVKNFTKTGQIEKFDQSQKPTKWAQLLAASLKPGRGIDFSGPIAFLTKTFTKAGFPVIVFSSFYHLGTSCHGCLGLAKPLL